MQASKTQEALSVSLGERGSSIIVVRFLGSINVSFTLTFIGPKGAFSTAPSQIMTGNVQFE